MPDEELEEEVELDSETLTDPDDETIETNHNHEMAIFSDDFSEQGKDI